MRPSKRTFAVIVFCICYCLFAFINQPTPEDALFSEESSIQNDNINFPRRLVEEVDSHIELPRPRVLLGIFTTIEEVSKRKWHKMVLESHGPKVCSLGEFQEKFSTKLRDCELIYTFVIGAGDKHTKIIQPTPKLLLNKEASRIMGGNGDDVPVKDCSLLNILESKDHGKSQTFLYFASRVIKEYGMDYVMKIESNTFLNLEKYFSTSLLPSPPYNNNILGGQLRDKAFWTKRSDRKQPEEKDLGRLEGFWGHEFEGVHLYMGGQCYFLSSDLVEFVVQESLYASSRIAPGGYLEFEEDHDISGMAWHSTTPIHAMVFAKSQRFWIYPVNDDDDWKRLVAEHSSEQ